MPRAGDLTKPHRAYEEIALPGRKTLAGVERHARRSNRGDPDEQRILHAFLRRSLRDARPLVRPAPAHARPAVVPARKKNVDFVAAVRAVFVLPDRPGLRMQSQSQLIPMTQGKDLRLVASLADERIVRRHAPII